MQRVIVTGGTRGIGAGISRVLHRHGYYVYALYLNRHADAQVLREELNDFGSVEAVDIRDRVAVADFFVRLKGRMRPESEGDHLISLVNCAGIYYSAKADNALDVFQTNVIGAITMTNWLAQFLAERPDRHHAPAAVVNIGSTSAWHGPTGTGVYAASKAALHRWADVEAHRYAVLGLLRMNTVVCGPVETELLQQSPNVVPGFIQQTPTGRLTTPEEVGEIVYFLIANRLHNLVGAQIALDGGRILWA